MRTGAGRWHHAGMRHFTFGLCLLLIAAPARAEPFSGRILDESGAPLANAVVATDLAPNGILTVEARAPGHYPFRHSALASSGLHRDITLVARRPERRLLVFAGDAMLARRYFEPRAGEPVLVDAANPLGDAKRLLAAIKPYVELADLASVNLESPLSAEPLTDPVPKLVTFYSPPELADALEWAGFDYVALGNNHTYDFREAGIRTTLEALESTGLGYSGAGHDDDEARRPFVSTATGAPLAFLSYVGWPGTFSPTQTATATKGGAALGSAEVFAADLAQLDRDAVAILQHHAGLEYAATPALSERTALRQAVDAGADVVIGHHAHVLQGVEVHKERLVAYSLGNFLFDQYHYTTQLGMLLFVWIDGERFHRAEIVPLNVNGYAPTPAVGAFADAVLNRIARVSAPLGTCFARSGAHAVVTSAPAGVACAAESVALPGPAPTPLALADFGASLVSPVRVEAEGRPWRIGTDLLRRGDFESFDRHGFADRSWMGFDVVRPDRHGNSSAVVRLAPGETRRAGMRVFERVFDPSSPATFGARFAADDDVTVSVYLQRRRTSEPLTVALDNDALTLLGRTVVDGGAGWSAVSFDFQQPRIATRSVRLLIELHSERGTEVRLDDLTWVQWSTPWLDADESAFGTHVQTAD